ncbi:hypothetical protein Enr13x_75860 [Stieleria neptunia]|uniref:Uncharacterized protein n=1 Tax=Stieleria neptunia TaxID=2527979 RepID=A0A518I3J9_9BACT|nr:hypothetical protein Enr13x_75860 [Stieleria neptunia]
MGPYVLLVPLRGCYPGKQRTIETDDAVGCIDRWESPLGIRLVGLVHARSLPSRPGRRFRIRIAPSSGV